MTVLHATMGDMRGALRKLQRRVGRRGAFLGFLAVLDGVIGYFLLNPPKGTPPQPYPLFPAAVWAWWWVGTAVVCAAGMFVRSDRIPYTAATLVKTAWGLRYAYLWYTGVPLAWVSMTIWLVFALIVVIISGWPEEVTVTLPPEYGGHDR